MTKQNQRLEGTVDFSFSWEKDCSDRRKHNERFWHILTILYHKTLRVDFLREKHEKLNLNIQISQILSVKDENINLLAAVHPSSLC